MKKEVTKVIVDEVRPRFRPSRRIRQIARNQRGLIDGNRRNDEGFRRRRRGTWNKDFAVMERWQVGVGVVGFCGTGV